MFSALQLEDDDAVWDLPHTSNERPTTHSVEEDDSLLWHHIGLIFFFKLVTENDFFSFSLLQRWTLRLFLLASQSKSGHFSFSLVFLLTVRSFTERAFGVSQQQHKSGSCPHPLRSTAAAAWRHGLIFQLWFYIKGGKKLWVVITLNHNPRWEKKERKFICPSWPTPVDLKVQQWRRWRNQCFSTLFGSEVTHSAENMFCMWLPRERVNLLRRFWPKFTVGTEKPCWANTLMSWQWLSQKQNSEAKQVVDQLLQSTKIQTCLFKCQTLAAERQFCSDSRQDGNNIQLCH